MQQVRITCDFREKASGIPQLLEGMKIKLSLSQLHAGDYIINDEIFVERKTAEDFIQSILSGRIFEQCSKLKRESKRILILIEGNPYITNHKIEEQAIRGAILSLLTSWQIPVLCTKDKIKTSEILVMLGLQSLENNGHRHSHYRSKSKKIKTQKLFFLQGIPSIGPTTAGRLIENFGDVKSIVNASNDELRKIKGIGKKNAGRILDFFST